MAKGKKVPKKIASKKAPGAAQKIRQGKAEMSDAELGKVSGGTSGKKSFNFT